MNRNDVAALLIVVGAILGLAGVHGWGWLVASGIIIVA